VKSEKVLSRRFKFDAKQEDVLHFRALTGQIVGESDRVFKAADLRLTLGSGVETILRSIGDDGEQELLMKIPLGPKNNTYSIDYEILR
jgi:hypothetical protein